MTASADKIQYILQTTLQETISLVKRGIFSQAQLQQIMNKRQKYQQNMLKKQFKITDYLAAIQYEYELQRMRKFRMESLSKLQQGINPLYKKQSSSDYAIVKRTVRLWDRTMHKYKFQPNLWKQYLSFAIAIGSKKHFYKALTNALRFLPFQIDFWRIGAAYQLEKGKNLWKGRKILIKGLKMVPEGLRNIELAYFLLQYEVSFIKSLIHRHQILIKGQQGIEMIQQQSQHSEQQQQQRLLSNMKLTEYDKIITIIIEQTILKNQNQKSIQLSFNSLKNKFINKIKYIKQGQNKQIIINILNKVIQAVQKLQIKNNQNLNQKINQDIFEVKQQKIQYKNQKTIFDWKQKVISYQGKLNIQNAKKSLSNLCLQPDKLCQMMNFMLNINANQTINILVNKKPQSKIPPATLSLLLDLYKQNNTKQLQNLLKIQIDKWLQPQDLRNDLVFLQKIVKFNESESRIRQTINIIRRLSIYYKYQPQFIQKCNSLVS